MLPSMILFDRLLRSMARTRSSFTMAPYSAAFLHFGRVHHGT